MSIVDPRTPAIASTSDAQQSEAANKIYDGNAATKPTPDVAGQLYGFSTLTRAIDSRDADLFAVAGEDTAKRQERRETYLTIAKETGLPEAVLTRLAKADIDERLRTARPQDDPEAAELAREKQIQSWNEEILADLRVRYGAKNAEQILDRSKRFVRAHSALAKILQSGLGSEPEIFSGISAHVFSTGWR